MQTLPTDVCVVIVFLLEKYKCESFGAFFWVQFRFTSLDTIFQNITPKLLRASSLPGVCDGEHEALMTTQGRENNLQMLWKKTKTKKTTEDAPL